MKAFAIVLLCIGVALAIEPYEKTCEGKADPGMCLAYVPSYYYDTETGTCKFFVYGGCQGNGNRYSSKEECEENCADRASDEGACTAKPETGLCDAYFPSYYYDPESGECKFFVYGGCGGNANRYRTKEECYDSCAGRERSDADVCSLSAETGPCRARIPRFFYNSKTGKCEIFTYGGCAGNGNRFKTEDECYQNCGPKAAEEEDVCSLEADGGMCRGYFPNFYFNSKTGQCEEFIYGGCQGNGNRFGTVEECESRCGGQARSDVDVCSLKAETGPCRAAFRKFFYNSESGKCEKFIYGGCRGNDNRFNTEEECYQNCGPKAAEEEDVCSLEADGGMCKGYFPKFYFNSETGHCEEFIYGGCQGNDNRFGTEEECEEKCGVAQAVEKNCEDEAESGPCQAYFPRYFFNTETGRCEEFIYGGCGGNGNNYKSAKECGEACGGP